MSDLLKNLKIDSWYMVFIIVGAVGFISSLTVPILAISNKQAMVLTSGILMIGLGEWKNHKYLTGIKPPNVYTGGTAIITQKIRRPDILGNFMVMIGLLFLVIAFLDISKFYSLL